MHRKSSRYPSEEQLTIDASKMLLLSSCKPECDDSFTDMQKKNLRLNTNNKSTGKAQRAKYLKSRRSDCMTSGQKRGEEEFMCDENEQCDWRGPASQDSQCLKKIKASRVNWQACTR
jgi:hypothetical protein